MKCTPALLLPPSSIPPYHPCTPSGCLSLVPPPPPPVLTLDSRRVLVTSARRQETAAIREKWKQHLLQHTPKSSTSRFRHPKSAPPELSPTASHDTSLDLRKRFAAYGYGMSNSPCMKRSLQFPELEQEVTKRNLTQRLPYYQKLELEEKERLNYPYHPHPGPSYPQVFFLSTGGARARKPSSPSPALMPRARVLRNQKEERYFVHPEWSSENVEWRRFSHNSNPAHFRYSWM